MKKIILSAAAIAVLGIASNAQSVRFGVKGGVNLSNSSMTSSVSVKSESSPLSLGAYGGVLSEISFKRPGDKFKGQIEVNYNYYNIVNKYAGSTSYMQLHSVSVPVLAKYFIIPELSLFGGPTFNINLAASSYSKTGTAKTSAVKNDNLNPFQIGFMVGANAYLYKGFFLQARYHYIAPQFNKIATGAPQFANANSLQFGIGYKF